GVQGRPLGEVRHLQEPRRLCQLRCDRRRQSAGVTTPNDEREASSGMYLRVESCLHGLAKRIDGPTRIVLPPRPTCGSAPPTGARAVPLGLKSRGPPWRVRQSLL